MSMVAVLSAISVLAGTGLGAWEVTAHKRRKQAMAAHLQTLLELREDSAGELIATQVYAEDVAHGLQWGPRWLKHAATWRTVVIALVVASLAAIPLLAMGLVWTGLGVWAAIVVVGLLWAWRQWQKMCSQIRLQLPTFIDNMVRLVVLGHAVQSAFLFAAAATKMPLQATVNQAASFAKAGMPVDRALVTASRHWDMEEFHLLAAIIQIGGRFGGRIDSLLERVANFMRDRQQAKQELHAMSAEVRLSAWVLGLLPLLIGGMVLVTNVDYFLQMWNDPLGRNVLFLALGMQLTGGFLLYRLAQMD